MSGQRRCGLEGCDRPHKGRGLCDMHIQRLRRTGTTASPVMSLAERFWSKVNKNGPVPEQTPELGQCWVWTATTNEHGYGVMRPEGQRTGPPVKAHRVSLELDGRPPGDKFALHACDNPPCVRPSHLRVGTHTENMYDRALRERTNRGVRNGQAILTDQAVVEIRARRAAGEPRKVLAREFDVSGTTITHVCAGTTWRHVPDIAS